MKILNVAEKPSVARSISSVLSANLTTRRGLHQYCPNICFSHNSQMVFTSVLGHLFSTDFENKSRWNDVDPEVLFTDRIVKYIQPDFIKIKENIEREALKCDMVIVWTDCDREGENIGRQIRDVVLGIKKIQVKRARFSGITLREIENALRDLDEINEAEANAVDARMELDLRIGSAFTRLQTLALVSHMGQQKNVLSFGPCQIPTLGFVVERARERERFVEESFWTLKIMIRKPADSRDQDKYIENVFSWNRGNIFDKNCVIYFYNHLLSGKQIIVSKKVNEKIKYRPLPLRTVELQKICTSYFKLSGHKVMEIAEALYNKGYISYPRTETDTFGKKFDYKDALGRLVGDGQTGEYAGRLLRGFKYPRNGKNDDMAHSPIYPLRDGNNLTGHDRSVYEFICRRFLGCLSDNAKGLETHYELEIKDEIFNLKGIKILERNYLEIYFYDKWDDKEVSDFLLDEIVCGELYIEDGKTSPPSYLTEAELISLMDKNGIGTDATIHEHILKIQERGYATKAGNEIRPMKLGMALIDGYEDFGLEVSKPSLRKNLESNLKKICSGEVDKDMVVSKEIKVYRDLYNILKNKMERFVVILKNGVEADVNNQKPNKRRSIDSSTRDARNENRANPDESTGNITRRKRGTSNDLNYRTGRDGGSNKNVEPEIISIIGRKDENIRSGRTSNKSIMCNCKLLAKVLETKKGNNLGKEFYCCHHFPKKCSFFQWVNDENGNGNQSINLMCFCGFEPQLLIANTDNNRGRKFYKCKKVFKPCKYFQWEN